MIISAKGKVSVQIEQYFSYKLINNWIKAKLSLTYYYLVLNITLSPPHQGYFAQRSYYLAKHICFVWLALFVSTRMFISNWFVLGTRIIL